MNKRFLLCLFAACGICGCTLEPIVPAPESVCFDRFGNLQCDASPICVNLFYQCRICSEGDVFCSINELKVCHSNRWVVEEICGPQETCDETAKACLIKIDVCENYCLDEHTLLECQKNGDYVEIPCSLGCSDGICKSELGCTPETYQCIDNKLMKCSEQRNWDVVAVCAQSEVCDAEGMQCINPGDVLEELENELCIPSDGSVTQIQNVTIAKLRSAVYGSENDENVKTTLFSDFEHQLMGFVSSGDVMDVESLLTEAGFDESSYLIDYEMTSSVPDASWLGTGYAHGEQVVPDFDISRYHIELALNHGETLENALASLAGVFGLGKTDILISETTCADDRAIFYLSRSDYEGESGIFSIYNGVLGCASMREEAGSNNKFALESLALMEDVISGTLTAPKASAVPSASKNGYEPFIENNCQSAPFEKISRAVDFLWVVDNSRSMDDKQQALAAAIPAFLKQLKDSGLDYRVAVTTTDAYTLDETAFKSFIWVENDYDSIKDGRPVADTYINGIGIRNGLSITSANSYYPGFISKPTAIIPVSGGRSYFTMCITSNSRCNQNKQNVCGSGYEDGLRSGTFVLSRLAVDTSDNKESVAEAKAMLNPYDLEMYDEIVDLKKQLANGQFLKYDESNDRYEDYSLELSVENVEQNVKDMKLRSDALKYIIWLSDEESRQFVNTSGLVVSSDKGALGCVNGNKLVDGMMRYGNAEDGSTASQACNPNMYKALETAIAKNIHEVKTKPGTTLFQDMSLDELRQQDGLKAYTDMLDYYLKEYRRYAGTGGIVGFSIVGDIGKQNGGICDNGMACSGTCYADAKDQTGHKAYMECSCYDCKAINSEYRNTGWSASDACLGGANYGLSYIHMARFLGLDSGGFGKEGGFASICNSNYDSVVTSIFEDVVGRVQTYPLKALPIASTIRVGVAPKNKTKTIELTRGAEKLGYIYDAASNSITFVGISDIGDEYSYVISYDSWSEK